MANVNAIDEQVLAHQPDLAIVMLYSELRKKKSCHSWSKLSLSGSSGKSEVLNERNENVNKSVFRISATDA